MTSSDLPEALMDYSNAPQEARNGTGTHFPEKWENVGSGGRISPSSPSLHQHCLLSNITSSLLFQEALLYFRLQPNDGQYLQGSPYCMLTCYGSVCVSDNRCTECERWDDKLVQWTCTYQLTLQHRCDSQSYKGTISPAVDPTKLSKSTLSFFVWEIIKMAHEP